MHELTLLPFNAPEGETYGLDKLLAKYIMLLDDVSKPLAQLKIQRQEALTR
jgi:hypothetical protein